MYPKDYKKLKSLLKKQKKVLKKELKHNKIEKGYLQELDEACNKLIRHIKLKEK